MLGEQVDNIKVDLGDMGKSDGLRSVIISMVANENYDLAIRELENYVQIKREYPNFKRKVTRYVEHCSDLIKAIKTKKQFLTHPSFSKAKRQELSEVVVEHFKELRESIRKIEKIELELRLDDLRSTVWVIRTLIFVIFSFFLLTFFLDLMKNGLYFTINRVSNDFSKDVINWLFNLF